MSDSGHYVRYPRGLLARHLSPDRRRSRPSLAAEIQPLHVRPPRLESCYNVLILCRAFLHLGCGLAVGLTGLAAGYCIGIVGDSGVRAFMEQSRIFVGMVLILIFGEVLGLYG